VAAVAQASAPAAGAPAASSQTPEQARQPHAERSRPFVILDAAHGGWDNGIELAPGLEEKTVTLALARRLQKELENRGVQVVLARTADSTLSLDQRAAAANGSHAALLVSIHAAPNGHGVRIYTPMIPARQQTEPAKRGMQPWELAQQPYLQLSARAAEAMARACTAQGLAVRSSAAPLRPLNNVTLAAVAVEIAPTQVDPKELSVAGYQQKVAAALAAGIAGLDGKLEGTQ